MMKDVLQYKGFIGSIHFSASDDVFFGKIEGINDLVTFEGSSVKEVKNSFKDAVEDYLEICKKKNIDPYKSFKGSFNVRIDPELHKKAFQYATLKGISLNQFIKDALVREIQVKNRGNKSVEQIYA